MRSDQRSLQVGHCHVQLTGADAAIIMQIITQSDDQSKTHPGILGKEVIILLTQICFWLASILQKIA